MTTSEGQPKLQSNSYPAHYTSSEDNDAEFKHNTGTEKNERSGNRRGWAIVVGSAVVSAFVAGGIAYGPKVFNKEAPEVVFNPAATAPEVPGLPMDTIDQNALDLTPKTSQEAWDMPANDFIENTTLAERVALINPDILANQETVINAMRPVLSDEDIALLGIDTPKPTNKIDYTDQQMLSELSLSIAGASIDKSQDTSEKMLSIAIDPETEENRAVFNSFSELVNGNASRVVFQSTESFRPLLPGMEFMGTTIGTGEEGRITKSNSINENGSIGNEHFRLLKVTGAEGNQAITQMGVWYGSDPRIKEVIRNQNLINNAN